MSSTFEPRSQALVQIAGLYILYYRDDHSFTYALKDPRATEVSEVGIRPLWTNGDLRVAEAWGAKGMGLFSLISMHFWEQLIDFHYIDVGANYGMTTVAQGGFYKRCGRNNRIYAFEPGEVFPLLQETVRLNRLDDMTTCVRAAVSDQAGEVEFHLTPAQSPASSLLSAAVHRTGIVETRSVMVEALRLDDFVDTIRHTAGLAIKIDAEGADFKVLRGMAGIRTARHAVIQIEFFPMLVDSYADPASELKELAQQYEMIEVGDTANTRIATSEIPEFVAGVRAKPAPATDILLIPYNLPAIRTLTARILNN
jgi:FkbM family methyltransferase